MLGGERSAEREAPEVADGAQQREGEEAQHEARDGLPERRPRGSTATLVLAVAIALGIPENKMRWIVPTDIGGGFGTKTGLYPYIALIALAAKKTGMTVKWIEDRREHLLASATGTDRVTYMEAAVKKDGTILGLKDKTMDNTGGYIRAPEPGCAYRSTCNHTGAYQILNLDREVMVVGTNKCLTAPNRGYTCQ